MTQPRESRCYHKPGNCKLAPGSLETVSVDLVNGRMLKTPGVQQSRCDGGRSVGQMVVMVT